jgi:hypothetical protein
MKDLVTRNKELEDQVFELLEVLELCHRTIESLTPYSWSAGYKRGSCLHILPEILEQPWAQASLNATHRRRRFQSNRK